MTNVQMQSDLNWLLLQASIRSKRGLVKLSEEYDLTLVQTYTICLMKEDESLPMNSLSTVLNCDASNVTGIVDRLVAREYMSRTECKEDRRIKTLALTAKGKKLRKELLQRTAEAQMPGLAALTKAETETLKHLLGKMLASCPPLR